MKISYSWWTCRQVSTHPPPLPDLTNINKKCCWRLRSPSPSLRTFHKQFVMPSLCGRSSKTIHHSPKKPNFNITVCNLVDCTAVQQPWLYSSTATLTVQQYSYPDCTAVQLPWQFDAPNTTVELWWWFLCCVVKYIYMYIYNVYVCIGLIVASWARIIHTGILLGTTGGQLWMHS